MALWQGDQRITQLSLVGTHTLIFRLSECSSIYIPRYHRMALVCLYRNDLHRVTVVMINVKSWILEVYAKNGLCSWIRAHDAGHSTPRPYQTTEGFETIYLYIIYLQSKSLRVLVTRCFRAVWLHGTCDPTSPML